MHLTKLLLIVTSLLSFDVDLSTFRVDEDEARGVIEVSKAMLRIKITLFIEIGLLIQLCQRYFVME